MGTQFIKIPRVFRQLKEGTKFIDILVYSAIEYQKDFSTGTSKIAMRTISSKYDISLSKVEDAVKRLVQYGLLDYKKVKSEKCEDYVYNEYSFPYSDSKKGFLMLNPDLLTQELKPKERGFLIYLQLLALPNMNEIEYTKIEEIASELSVSRQTASKYLKRFLEIKQISMWKDYYVCKYLKK